MENYSCRNVFVSRNSTFFPFPSFQNKCSMIVGEGHGHWKKNIKWLLVTYSLHFWPLGKIPVLCNCAGCYFKTKFSKIYIDTRERTKADKSVSVRNNDMWFYEGWQDFRKGHRNCSIYFLCRLFCEKGKKKKLQNLEKSKVRTHGFHIIFLQRGRKFAMIFNHWHGILWIHN